MAERGIQGEGSRRLKTKAHGFYLALHMICMYSVFKVIQIIVLVFQTALAIADHLLPSGKPTSYERSAQICDIWWRNKLHPIMFTSKHDFLLTYRETTHPNYILRPNVSLYDVNEHELIFVETDMNKNIFTSDVSPWLQIAQYQHARRVIILPVWAAHKLASQVSNEVPVKIIMTPGRCGSTLLGRMIEQVPGTQVHSEPPAFAALQSLSSSIEARRYRMLHDTCCRLMFSTCGGVTRYCIKMRSYCNGQVQLIQETLPQSQVLYLYRAPIPFCNSFNKMLNAVIGKAGDILHVVHLILFYKQIRIFFPSLVRMARVFVFGDESDNPFSGNDDLLMQLNPPGTYMGFIAEFWAYSATKYIELRKKTSSIIAIKYTDLARNAKLVCSRVFEHFELDKTYIEKALKATQHDSQANSEFSHRKLSSANYDSCSAEELRVIANTVMSLHQLPAVETETDLPGTIQFP